jgi:TolA-binding protein
MRAVQRKVFPDGAGRLVQPEITPERSGIDGPAGVPASSPVADLTARVATLEQQVATLTGQVEQNGFRVRQLDEAFNAYKRSVDERMRALEQGAASRPATTPAAGDEPAADEPPARPATPPRAAATRPAATPAVRPAAPDAEPTTAASTSGDAAEDAYMRGYRFWEAKQYAEAERQLKEVVAKHPRHRRASYAQNLLGRTYLDQGKPSLASIAFYENYKKMPDGERAPHSLYYLAQALQTLKKPADACKVYGELSDVYGAKIGAQIKADIAKGRAAAQCGE